MDYTKPLETAIAVASGDVPLNEQVLINLQLRNANTENEQSAIENTKIQSNTVTTGTYVTNIQHSMHTA